MRKRCFLALLAAACMAVGCTNDLEEVTSEEVAQENELKLVFSSSTNGEIYPKSRAIATAEENAIENLTVYVFSSSTEIGTYYLLDTWTSAETQANTNQQFKLQPSGGNYKASIYPRKVKDAKYLKLYCVANSNIYSNATGSPATLTKCSDAGFSQGNPTTMATFDTYYTLNVTTGGDPLKTPLTMTGIMNEPLHVTGNYGTASVELKRRVARFDIDNNAARTKLTIKSISIEQAEGASYLFSTKNGYFAGSKINYPEIDYTKLENANLGVTTSAMYVHPTAGSNNLMLVIKGLYAGKNEVTYRLRVARTNASNSLENITIEPNHRYSLRIAEVTTSEIVGYFEVEDWIDGGSVDVKPSYDKKPEIIAEGVKAVAGQDPFEGLNDKDNTFWTPADSTIRVAKAGQFTVTVKAPGQCSVKSVAAQNFVTRAVSAVNNWLTVTGPTVTEADGMILSTFTFTVNANATHNAIPFDLTFINNAASVDPAFQLKYRVLPPATLTENTNIAASTDAAYSGNSSNGNIITTKDSEAMTLNVGKKYYVDVCSPYLAVPTCNELTNKQCLVITEVKRDAAKMIVTYCFDLKSIPEDIDTKNDYKITFTNTFDATGAKSPKPVSVDYALTLASTETVVNAVQPLGDAYTNSPTSSLNVTSPTAPTGTLYNVQNNVLYIAFAKEMIVEVPEAQKSIITVTPKTGKARDSQFVYEIKVANKAEDGSVQAGEQISEIDIKFKNKLDARKVTTLKLSLKKEEAQPDAKTPEGGTFTNSEGSELLLTNAKAPTGTIINKTNNVLFIAFEKEVDVVVPEEDKSYIHVEKQSTGSNKVYQIKIVQALDESSVSPGAQIKSINIQFKNKLDAAKITTLQLSIKKALN